MHDVGSDERDPAHDCRSDTQPPVGVLVETHDLSGESHPEGEQQQNAARDPGQLTWIFECPKQEHLYHVDHHDADHEVGAPKMQRAKIPAEGLLKIQILQTRVGLISRGHVDKGQTDAGDDLEDKTKQGAATEDIKPTACTCRHCVTCGGFEELANMQSVINPKGNVSQHARFLFCTTALGAKTPSCRLLKKISEARRTKIDERRRTLIVR